jgi:HEAT repeat protein
MLAVFLPWRASAAAISDTALAKGREQTPALAWLLGDIEDPLKDLTSKGGDPLENRRPPPSAQDLMKRLSAAEPADRLDAVWASAVRQNIAAVPPLTGLLLRLDEKPALRAAAATALGRIGIGLAAGSLIAALKDPAPEVRYTAALALGRLRSGAAAESLSQILRSDGAWWVRYAASIALGRTGGDAAVPALRACLLAEPDWRIRLQAVRSLQDNGGTAAAEAVSLALNDKDPGVRTLAASALAELKK